MGTTKCWWVLTIASSTLAAVLATEVNAGVELTPQLSDLQGFSFDNTPIDVPDMSNPLITKIPGEDAIADCMLTFYEDKVSNPAKTALVKGTIGFVVIFGYGIAGAIPAIADKCDVWPVQVSSSARQYASGAAASKYIVKFAPRQAPVVDRALT